MNAEDYLTSLEKLKHQKKEFALGNILKQYENSFENKDKLAYIEYNDLNESVYWEDLTKEIFDEKMYTNESLIIKDGNHVIDINLDYDGGFGYYLYPIDTPITNEEKIEPSHRNNVLKRGYIEPVLHEEYEHNVIDEKSFEKILEDSSSFFKATNTSVDLIEITNEPKKVRKDR